MKITNIRNSALTLALGVALTACVVSGHPSTDKRHSHVDTSSTRYDVYDPNYDYHDHTKHLNKKRLYNTHDADAHRRHYYDDDHYDDGYTHRDSYYDNSKRYNRNKALDDKLARDDKRYFYDSDGDAYYHDERGHRVYVTR